MATMAEQATQTIRVLLAEDQAMVRGALAALLALEPDIDVVAEVSRGDEIVPAALAAQPDVALLDIELPGVDGLEAATALSALATNSNGRLTLRDADARNSSDVRIARTTARTSPREVAKTPAARATSGSGGSSDTKRRASFRATWLAVEGWSHTMSTTRSRSPAPPPASIEWPRTVFGPSS